MSLRFIAAVHEVRKLTQYVELVTKMASFSRKVELIFQWSGWECQSEEVKFSSNGYYELCKTLALSQFKRGKFLATCQSRSRKQYYFLLILKIAKFFPKENLIWP